MGERGDRVHSELYPELDGNRVARPGERLAEGERAKELAVAVSGLVCLAVRKRNLQRRVLDDGVRRRAVGDRERVDDRLERGARLPDGHHSAVERRFLVVPTADECTDLTVDRVDSHNGALEVITAALRPAGVGRVPIARPELDRGCALDEGDGRGALERGIESGVNPVATVGHGNAGPLGLLPDDVDEIGRGR